MKIEGFAKIQESLRQGKDERVSSSTAAADTATPLLAQLFESSFRPRGGGTIPVSGFQQSGPHYQDCQSGCAG